MNYQKLPEIHHGTPQVGQAYGYGTYGHQVPTSQMTYVNGYPQFTGYAQTTAMGTYGVYAQTMATTQNVQEVYESKPYKEDYSHKKIENSIIKRSEIAGFVEHGQVEFDDYFEKHIEKFFTPEFQEFNVYHHQGYIYGIQILYRDSWGKTHKETFKGELHMAPNVAKEHCERSKIVLAYDEFIKEAFVEAGEYVTFLKIVTNKDQVLSVGQQLTQSPKNIIPEHSRAVAVAGTFNICLNSVYFYYT